MKVKVFFFRILFLFLGITLFIGCEAPEIDDQLAINKNSVDKGIERPGTQGGK